jgi:hypothetical protein
MLRTIRFVGSGAVRSSVAAIFSGGAVPFVGLAMGAIASGER